MSRLSVIAHPSRVSPLAHPCHDRPHRHVRRLSAQREAVSPYFLHDRAAGRRNPAAYSDVGPCETTHVTGALRPQRLASLD